ncbi:IncP-type conjugal transfer protein TrbI (plasmid) [Nitrobacteraceae bacterium UC4446_H13]
MTQSLDLNGAAPNGPKMRRLNRLPVIVAIVLAVLFFGVIFYGLSTRGLYFRGDRQADGASSGSASTYADQMKRGVPNGIIDDPNATQVLQPTPPAAPERPVANPFTPARDSQPQQTAMETDEAWRLRMQREQQEQFMREQQRQRMARYQANGAAYDSPLAINLAKLQTNAAASAPTTPPASTTVGARPTGTADLYAAAMRAGLGQPVDPNGQTNKESFINQDLKKLGYVPNAVVPQRSPYELKRGSVIPATLFTGINSDLPGRITAQVSQNVFDSATGHHLLIPQGTRLLGRYDSKVTFGQSRVLVVWTDIILPNGSTLEIGAMAGTDAEGYGGFKDQVDNHYFQIFGSAILIAAIGAGTEMAIPRDRSAFGMGNSAEYAARRSFVETFGRVAERTISKNMDVQPTLEIRPGYKFNVLVDQDMVFPSAYRS